MNAYDSRIIRHLNELANTLQSVPEVRPGLAIIRADPNHAVDVYNGYIYLIGSMAALTEAELVSIDNSQESVNDPNLEEEKDHGSASMIGANDIVRAMGDDKKELSVIAGQSYMPVLPGSTAYSRALHELKTRMEEGSRRFGDGETPSDSDPATHEVIWGHTKISPEYPETLLHFVVCHYLERYFAETLTAKGYEFAKEKDFFINALDDVLILDDRNQCKYSAIFELWSRTKEDGGLGWITQARINSYKEKR